MTVSSETVVARPAPDTLDLRRRYAAPVALLWRLWADPRHFSLWWGPRGMRCTRCEIDLRPGGAWLTTMTSAEGDDHTVSGVYREIVARQRLVYTWGWENEGGRGHESTVTVTFHAVGQAAGEGCEVRVLHAGLGPDQPDPHQSGWTGALECLADHIAQGTG